MNTGREAPTNSQNTHMSFLQDLHALLHGSESVSVTISKPSVSNTEILITSKLSGVDPDTKDPRRAALQSALAMPLRIVVAAGTDIDAAFESAMSRYTAARIPAIDSLSDIAGKLATVTKAAKSPAPQKAGSAASKSPSKQGVKREAPTDDGEAEGDQDGQVDANEDAASGIEPAVQNAGPTQASIFD